MESSRNSGLISWCVSWSKLFRPGLMSCTSQAVAWELGAGLGLLEGTHRISDRVGFQVFMGKYRGFMVKI